MNAVISGQAGVAVLVDGLKLASIHAGSDGEAVARRPGEVRFLLGDAKDLEFVDGVQPEEVRRRLEVAASRYDALHLALILLDGELSHDTRRTTAEELDDLLGDQGISGWVESVLYAHPLPSSADPVGARSACTGRTERTRAFLSKLESLQMVIAEVYQAWEGIPTSVFGTNEDRAYALSVAVKAGLFRDLVAIRASGKPVGSVLFQVLKDPSTQELHDDRQVLMKWIAGFQDQQETYSAPKLAASFVAENGYTPQAVCHRREVTALEATLSEERSKILREAIEELPPQMRQAVYLRVEGNLKYREIAELMNVSIETVKAHLYQARQQLKRKLANYFSEEDL
jgi:RNA polymerase sigma factor (sigma-70 family)